MVCLSPVLVVERGVCARSSPAGHGWPAERARTEARSFRALLKTGKVLDSRDFEAVLPSGHPQTARRAEKWLVEDRLAGGWGVVYILRNQESQDPELKLVAAKTVRPEFAADPRRLDRFSAECYVWLSLGSHKNVVRLFTVERIGGQPFALGEYVPQAVLPNTLRGWLDSGLVELEVALRFGVHICRAIQHARSRGVLVHQDLKPENVMITPSGVAKVSDWGLSRHDIFATELASSGAVPYSYKGESEPVDAHVHGTRGYAAPECIGAEVAPTPPSDMFSLGVCIVEMLRGSRPGPDAAAAEIAGGLGSLSRSAALPLVAELARCLSSRSSDRPTSTIALQAAMAKAFYELAAVPIESEPECTPERPSDVGMRAYALFMLGKLDEAMALQNQFVAQIGWQPPGDLADLRVLMDYKEAGWKWVVPEHHVVAAEEELSVHPDDLDRLDKALRANDTAGHWDRAMELCRWWLERRPEDVAKLRLASRLAQQLGEGAAAQGYLDHTVELEPENAELWLERARMLEGVDLAAALSSVERAVKLAPDNAEALIIHGNLLLLNGERAAALRQFDSATAVDPTDARGWFNVGTIMRNAGRNEEAAVKLARAADLGLPQAMNSLGAILATSGAPEKATAYFERAIAADPHYGRPWFNLGQVYEKLGRYEKARAAYERAVAIQGSYELAEDGLRRLAARRGW